MMMKVKSSGQEISVADVRIKDIREAAFWKKHLSRNDYYNEMGQGKKMESGSRDLDINLIK